VELYQLGRALRPGCGSLAPGLPMIGASKDIAMSTGEDRGIATSAGNSLVRLLVARGRFHLTGVEFCTKSPLRHATTPPWGRTPSTGSRGVQG